MKANRLNTLYIIISKIVYPVGYRKGVEVLLRLEVVVLLL